MTEEEKNLRQYRKDAIKAAIDFNYGHETLIKLEKADRWGEIHNIMVTARKAKFGE